MVHDVGSQLYNIPGQFREAVSPVLLLWHKRDEVDRFDQPEAKECVRITGVFDPRGGGGE